MGDRPKAFGPTLRRNMAGAFLRTMVEVLESRPGLLAAVVIGSLVGAIIVALVVLRLRGLRSR